MLQYLAQTLPSSRPSHHHRSKRAGREFLAHCDLVQRTFCFSSESLILNIANGLGFQEASSLSDIYILKNEFLWAGARVSF